MKYEKTRKEFYEREIHSMAEQMAELLDKGYSVEIGKSRSGLKLFAVSRRHEVVKRKGNMNE
jgi:hypothetical protein